MSEFTDSPAVWREGADVAQGSDLVVPACLGDDGAAVGVADQHDRSGLLVYDPAGCGDVAFKRQRGILHDGDVVAVSGQDVVDPLPA